MRKTGWILILLLAFVQGVLAQTPTPETFTYSSKDGLFAFQYPSNLVIGEDTAGRISFATNEDSLANGVQASGDILGTIFTPAYLARFNGLTLDSTTADVMAIILAEGEYADPAPYPLPDALQTTATTDNGQRFVIVFDTGNGISVLTVDTWREELQNHAEMLFQMAGSARNGTPVPLPLAQTFTAPEVQFSYPAGWIVADSAEPGTYFFANSEQAAGSYVGTTGVVQGTVYPPEFITDTLGFAPDASLLEVAVQIPSIFSQDILFEPALPVTIGTRHAYVTAGINNVDIEAYIYILETDRGIGLMLAAGPMVELVQYEPTFEAMLTTLEFDVEIEVAEIPEVSPETPLTQKFTLADESLTFTVPETWAAAESVPGAVYLANDAHALDRMLVAAPPASGELQVLIMNSDFLAAQEVDVHAEPLEIARQVINKLFGDLNFDFTEPFEAQLGDLDVIQWEAVNAEVETVGYLIPVKDGVVVMFCGAPLGELWAYRQILPKIAETMIE